VQRQFWVGFEDTHVKPRAMVNSGERKSMAVDDVQSAGGAIADLEAYIPRILLMVGDCGEHSWSDTAADQPMAQLLAAVNSLGIGLGWLGDALIQVKCRGEFNGPRMLLGDYINGQKSRKKPLFPHTISRYPLVTDPESRSSRYFVVGFPPTEFVGVHHERIMQWFRFSQNEWQIGHYD
jgi:hypothetical protein